jgi:hypothetical protein
MPSAEDRRVGRAVDLGQGHEHRRFDRAKPAVGGCPLAKVWNSIGWAAM